MVVENFIDPGWGLEVELPDGTILRVDVEDGDEDEGVTLAIIDTETFHLPNQHSQKSHAGGSVSTVDGDGAAVYRAAEDQFVEVNGRYRDLSAGEQAQIDAVRGYKGSRYRPMNRMLRGETPYSDARDNDEVRREIGHLDEALKGPAAVKNGSEIRVYRGMDRHPQMDQLRQRGTVFTEDGFVSSTPSRRSAEGYSTRSGVVLEILVPRGTPMVAGEIDELILPRGQSFQTVESTDDTVTVVMLT